MSNVFYILIIKQLVQFLLKQAGVDKRTGDLYGNRDLLNIARNMARGLKVCSCANCAFCFWPSSLPLCWIVGFSTGD